LDWSCYGRCNGSLNRSGNWRKVVGTKNHIATISLVRTESIIRILVAFTEIVTSTAFETTESDLILNIGCATKVREASVFAESFARRAFFTKSTKVSFLAFACSLGFAHGDAFAVSGTVNTHFNTWIAVTSFAQPLALADTLLVGDRHFASEITSGTRAVFSTSGVGTKINFAIESRESSFALAGFGTAIAIGVRVASALAFIRTLSCFDNSRKFLLFGAAIE